MPQDLPLTAHPALRALRERPGLAALFVLQSLCAAFFAADTLGDVVFKTGPTFGFMDHDLFEGVVTLVLCASVGVTGRTIWRLMSRQAELDAGMRTASGAFAAVLDEQFEAWRLTPSEREVAVLALKGFSIAEMAAIRGTKDGTLKAQCAAVYRKAGVSGRPQLLSHFIEDLLAEPMVSANAKADG